MISEKEFVDLVLEKSKTLELFKSVDYWGEGGGLKTQRSGVLVIIHFKQKYTPTIIFTKRSSHLRLHGGEISFPGGRASYQDHSLLDTAIRETYEEIGLPIQKEKIIGSLSPTNTYTTKILIYPFIAVLDKISYPLEPNEEVEQIIEIPLEILKDHMTIDDDHSSKDNKMFKFSMDGYLIWGATARILRNLFELIYPC